MSRPVDAPASPRLGVSVLLRRGGAVLLVRRGRGAYAGLWSLPGGHVGFGERLREAALRELAEETGISGRIDRLLDLVEILLPGDDRPVDLHYVLAVFEASPVGGSLRAGDDAAEARWVDGTALDDLAMTPETARLLGRSGRP